MGKENLIISAGNFDTLIKRLKKVVRRRAPIKSIIFERTKKGVRTIGHVYKSGRRKYYKQEL